MLINQLDPVATRARALSFLSFIRRFQSAAQLLGINQELIYCWLQFCVGLDVNEIIFGCYSSDDTFGG